MQISDVDNRFIAILTAAGVDLAAPDPHSAWEAFKQFAAELIDGLDPDSDRDLLLFEAVYREYSLDERPALSLTFQRQYTLEEDGEYAGMRYALCTFDYPPEGPLVSEPGVQEWGSPGERSREWIDTVEASAFFALTKLVPIQRAIEHGDI